MSTAKHPDERARRRIGNTKTGDWVKLPVGGRHEPAPTWPLVRVEMDEFYEAVWIRLWTTPMAMMWEQSSASIQDVAMYVVCSVDGETNLDRAKEARMLSDRLGLNPLGRLKLHWMIVPDAESDLETKPAASAAPQTARPARRRLSAVPDVLEA